MVPPYFGVPRLSHQFPVLVVVVAAAAVVVVLVEVDTTACVEVVVVTDVVVVVVAFDVVVFVDELQDVKTSEITMRPVRAQITPLFI
jgi:hypothetical protein